MSDWFKEECAHDAQRLRLLLAQSKAMRDVIAEIEDYDIRRHLSASLGEFLEWREQDLRRSMEAQQIMAD